MPVCLCLLEVVEQLPLVWPQVLPRSQLLKIDSPPLIHIQLHKMCVGKVVVIYLHRKKIEMHAVK